MGVQMLPAPKVGPRQEFLLGRMDLACRVTDSIRCQARRRLFIPPAVVYRQLLIGALDVSGRLEDRFRRLNLLFAAADLAGQHNH